MKTELKNVKYTTDGKKVVVIGDLNQTEKIVQEIYVTSDDCEMPMGERFVVKSLLDSPAKSWKEKQLEEIESRYNSKYKEWELRIEKLNSEKQDVYKSLSNRVQWLRQVAKQPHPESLKKVVETLSFFLEGVTKWIVLINCSDWILEEFTDDGMSRLYDTIENSGWNESCVDKMRLVSIFGRTNGDFEYRINRYEDGSGSDSGNVLYFKSKEDAINYLQNKLYGIKEYCHYHITISEKLGLKLNEETLNKYKDATKSNLLNEYETIKKQLLAKEEQISKL